MSLGWHSVLCHPKHVTLKDELEYNMITNKFDLNYNEIDYKNVVKNMRDSY